MAAKKRKTTKKARTKTTNATRPTRVGQPTAARLAGRLTVSGQQSVALLYGGLGFLFVSAAAVVALIWQLVRAKFFPIRFDDPTMVQFLDHYMAQLGAPLLLLAAAILTSAIGYVLLRSAGMASKEVIPTQDYELLSTILLDQKDKGVDHYIRLSSLTGVTGFFTKIGLSGLPLATIALTLIFALLFLVAGQEDFFDLAKLTLGAFLGSYVQRRVERRGTAS